MHLRTVSSERSFNFYTHLGAYSTFQQEAQNDELIIVSYESLIQLHSIDSEAIVNHN